MAKKKRRAAEKPAAAPAASAAAAAGSAPTPPGNHISSTQTVKKAEWPVECRHEHYKPRVAGCHTMECKRIVIDKFVPSSVAQRLLGIARKTMRLVGWLRPAAR